MGLGESQTIWFACFPCAGARRQERRQLSGGLSSDYEELYSDISIRLMVSGSGIGFTLVFVSCSSLSCRGAINLELNP